MGSSSRGGGRCEVPGTGGVPAAPPRAWAASGGSMRRGSESRRRRSASSACSRTLAACSSSAEATAAGRKSFPRYSTTKNLSRASSTPPVSACTHRIAWPTARQRAKQWAPQVPFVLCVPVAMHCVRTHRQGKGSSSGGDQLPQDCNTLAPQQGEAPVSVVGGGAEGVGWTRLGAATLQHTGLE